MKTIGVIVAGLAGIWLLFKLLGFAFGLLGVLAHLFWLAVLVAVCIFVIGLVRRALRV